MIDSILLGFVCGAWAFLWCGPLTRPGMLGNIVPVLYWKILGKHTYWKEYISKPLFECAVCNSFWIAFFAVFKEPTTNVMLSLVVVVSALFSAFYLTQKYD